MNQRIIQFKAGVTVCFIIKGDHCVLIDTGVNFSRGKYLEVFAQNNIEPVDIKLVIVTHGHFDHFAHLRLIKELTGASVLCHRHAVASISTGGSAPVIPANWIGKIMKRILSDHIPDYLPVHPDIIIDDDYDLGPYGIQGKIIHTPGHSDCSLSVILDSGEAFTGDIFMNSYFNKNCPLPAIFAVDKLQLRSSMQRVLDHGAEMIFGSHGGTFKRVAVEGLVKRLSDYGK